MIIDNLANDKLYYPLHENFKAAFDFLKSQDLLMMENGKYEIIGDDVFVMIQDYNTKLPNTARFEAHRTYIDIQHIIEGAENMGYLSLAKLNITQSYNSDKDVVFGQGDGTFCKVSAGEFVIFMPEDAHMPCMSIDKPQYVKKAVVKVRVK